MTLNTDYFDIRQIAESGQCFRMIMTGQETARIIAMGRILYIKDLGGGRLDLSCSEEEYRDVWRDYLDLDEDYGAFIASIDPADEYLIRAASAGRGIRILRQEPFETLISFIISQRRNIPSIMASVEKLCLLCGDRIEGDLYAFPTPDALASLSDKELSECSLGYRLPYVRECAKAAAEGSIDLDAMSGLDDEALFDSLTSLKGVGKKVANCVMLFAYHRIASFPVDVWIQRVIDEHYGGSFPLVRYSGYAGVLQQYIFHYARSLGREDG